MLHLIRAPGAGGWVPGREQGPWCDGGSLTDSGCWGALGLTGCSCLEPYTVSRRLAQAIPLSLSLCWRGQLASSLQGSAELFPGWM